MTNKNKRSVKTAGITLVLIMFIFTSCSVKMLTVNSTALFMEDVVQAFFEEEDIDFAEKSAPANLKLLDGLIKASQGENDSLLLKGCKLYGMYAMGFLEDTAADKKQDRKNLKKASRFYLRAKNYGMAVLTKNNDFKNVVDKSTDEFKTMMIAFGKDDVEALFWTAFAWGEYINLNRNKIAAVADLPKPKAMIDRVIELDPEYFYGMPHLFLIVYYSMPVMYGGDQVKAMAAYEKAVDVSGGKFILAHFFMAKYYAVQQMDEELFDELLDKVEEADDGVIPERLFTQAAKKKAELLGKKKKTLF